MAILESKKPWLTDEEKARVAELARYRALYEGRHRELFYTSKLTRHLYKAVGGDTRNVLYLTENWPGRCVLKYADLLYGEPLAIAASDDANAGLADAIKRVTARGRIHQVLFQAAVESAWAGSAWVQPLIRRGSVVLESVAPETVFPRYERGTRILLGCDIKYKLTVDGRPCVRVIRHESGTILQELWSLDDKTGAEVVDPLDLALLGPGISEAQQTHLTRPAIVEIPNYSAGGIGASDFYPFPDVGDLVDEINNRRTQIARILDQHGDPAAEVASKLLDANGNVQISGKAIPNDDMDNPAVRYLTWEANLTDQAAALVSGVNAFVGHMEIAPTLVGLGGGATSAETWKKLKLQSSQTLARVNRKQLYAAPAVYDLIDMTMQLDVRFAAAPSFTPGEVTLTWSDGLPVDEEDLQRIVTGYTTADLMSRRTALRWIHGDWTEKQVDDELAEIDAEREARMPSAFRNGGLDLHDEPGPTPPPGDQSGGKPPEDTDEQ